jgi:hypothetical protein
MLVDSFYLWFYVDSRQKIYSISSTNGLGAREPRQIYNDSTQQEKVPFVDVVGIEASKAELLEIVASIKFAPLFLTGPNLPLLHKWYPHLEHMGRGSLLILSDVKFILTRNCSPRVQPLSIPQVEMCASQSQFWCLRELLETS